MRPAHLPLALTALIGWSAAQAQVTGSIRRDDEPTQAREGRFTGDAARAIGDKFATCVVRRHYTPVVKALEGPPDFAHDLRTLPRFLDSDCLGGGGSGSYGGMDVEMRTNPEAFRGGLYKALVQHDFGHRAIVTFGPSPVDIAGYQRVVHGFADCVVRTDPSGSLRTVTTTAGTPAEQKAIEAIVPALKSCSTAGMKIRFSKGDLVGFLAEAYYREASASRQTSSH